MLRNFLFTCICSIFIITYFEGTVLKAEDSVIRLTNHKSYDYHCKWSPDGKQIVFTSRRSGEPKLYVIPSIGGDIRLVETGLSGDHHTGWSPDSKYLIFDASSSDNRPPGLWLISISDNKVRQLVPDFIPAFQPAMSPDGEWIAFASLRSGNADIWKAKLNGDSLMQLAKYPHITSYHPIIRIYSNHMIVNTAPTY